MDDGIVISNTWLENMVVWKLEEDGTITSSSADLSLMAAKKQVVEASMEESQILTPTTINPNGKDSKPLHAQQK